MTNWSKNINKAINESYKDFDQYGEEADAGVIGGPTETDETEETEVVEQAPVEDVIADLIAELSEKIELDEEGQPVDEESIKFSEVVEKLELAKIALVGEEEVSDDVEETEETEELEESEETDETDETEEETEEK